MKTKDNNRKRENYMPNKRTKKKVINAPIIKFFLYIVR